MYIPEKRLAPFQAYKDKDRYKESLQLPTNFLVLLSSIGPRDLRMNDFKFGYHSSIRKQTFQISNLILILRLRSCKSKKEQSTYHEEKKNAFEKSHRAPILHQS